MLQVRNLSEEMIDFLVRVFQKPYILKGFMARKNI